MQTVTDEQPGGLNDILHEVVSGSDAPSCLLIVPDHLDRDLMSMNTEPFSGHRTLVFRSEVPAADQIHAFAQSLLEQLQRDRVKKLSLIGIGRGGNLVQALAISGSRILRHVVLVNSTTRVAPTRTQRLLDKTERLLPLGLPLRSAGSEFDSRPNLLRMRCPTLVITDADATPFQREQATLIAKTTPNAWREQLTTAVRSQPLGPEMVRLLSRFFETPTKRPQKNRAV